MSRTDGGINKSYMTYAGLYVLTYGALGALAPLLGQYLDGIGFTGAQIGVITSAGTTVAIFASTFWGSVYSGVSNKYRVMVILCLAAAVLGIFLPNMRSYAFVLIIYAVMYFFQSPVCALTDAMTMESGQAFGSIRAWGAIGYAIIVFIAGKAAEEVGLDIIFTLYAACFITAAAVTIVISRRERNLPRMEKQMSRDKGITKEETLSEATQELCGAPATGKGGALRKLFSNRLYMQILVCGFFVMGTNVANNTYFSFLYTECGGTLAGIGATFLLMVGSEAPFMAWSAKLSEKFSMEKMILAAMVISVLRYAWYATGPSNIMISVLFFLQGMVNGIVLVEFVRYCSKVVEPVLIGIAISFFYAVASNGSSILCQLVGGTLLDYFGARGVYLFFALFNIIGVVLYCLFRLYREPSAGSEGAVNEPQKRS